MKYPLSVAFTVLLAAPAVPVFAADDGQALFSSKPCVACHRVDQKLVGPALNEVAAKYPDDDATKQRLADHIKNGTSGNWGQIPMPPNAVTEEEALKLAEWVLGLK
ncbi:cytochrome C-551 [Marinobacter nanhaiticus D15-8W]|uniref:Cytochrome c-551 n=1 Tax=Marinobacter nanhaiticus D15-8W TaxID=626887 RepID=N6W1I5_9GAMM|nr:c-type cytochrome [Marinobacter nanhaiticus]ENO16380.1 cytochrome C biogenesis protein CcsA [Marinobacter nanhaiticus D15-8W]BES72759.1 cytochrome C-551 [Marinobacter nanhaiticus D15-8W]